MEKPSPGTLLVVVPEGNESGLRHEALNFCAELILIVSKQAAGLHCPSVGWRSAILLFASEEARLEYLWTALIHVTLTHKEHIHLVPERNHPDSAQSLTESKSRVSE